MFILIIFMIEFLKNIYEKQKKVFFIYTYTCIHIYVYMHMGLLNFLLFDSFIHTLNFSGFCLILLPLTPSPSHQNLSSSQQVLSSSSFLITH